MSCQPPVFTITTAASMALYKAKGPSTNVVVVVVAAVGSYSTFTALQGYSIHLPGPFGQHGGSGTLGHRERKPLSAAVPGLAHSARPSANCPKID